MMAYAECCWDLSRFDDASPAWMCAAERRALAGTTPAGPGTDSKAAGAFQGEPEQPGRRVRPGLCAEIAFAVSMAMGASLRLCEELVLWCSWEYKFIELDDAFSTGSSIMPEKKNPDIAELIRGKSGRVFGDLMGLLTMMKDCHWHTKDMQEDKEAVFDAVDTLKPASHPLIPCFRP